MDGILRKKMRLAIATLFCSVAVPVLAASVSPYNVSYSGRIVSPSGQPLSGPVDLNIAFFTAVSSGTQKGTTYPFTSVTLTDGLFQVTLPIDPADFTTIFGGTTPTWVQVTDVTNLSAPVAYPRQMFTAIPYAIRLPVDDVTVTFNASGQLSLNNSAASGAQIIAAVNSSSSTINSARLPALAGDVTGAPGSTTVAQIQNKPVSAPSGADSGKFLQYNGTGFVMASVSGASGGTVTSVTAAAPISVTSATSTPSLILPRAALGQDGYLAASDWAAFNAKMSTLSVTPVAKSGDTMSGALLMDAQNEVRFGDSSAGNYLGLKAPASVPASVHWTLPPADGSGGQLLTTNGSGALTWSSPAGLVSAVAGRTGAVTLTTDDVSEGTPLYFTPSRVRSALSAASPLNFNNSTGVVSINLAGGNINGFISSSDWSTFNSKQNALSAAGSVSSGYLMSSDWIAFNSKADSGHTHALVGDVTSSGNSLTVTALQGRAVDATTPTTGQVLKWNGTSWGPGIDLTTTGNGGVGVVDGQSLGTGSSLFVDVTSGMMRLRSLVAGSGIAITQNTNDVTIASSQVPYSDTRARAALMATAPLMYDNNTGVFGISTATEATPGFLTAVDWNAFNAKQNLLGYAPLSRAGDTMSGPLTMGVGAELRLMDGNGAYHFGLKAPISLPGNITFTAPTVDGSPGQVLTTDGAGRLSFVSVASAPVSSVAGRTGAVTLTTADVAEGPYVYFTNTRARAALSANAPLTYDNGTGQIQMIPSAVTAGSYSRANITVDTFGRLISASNGTSAQLSTGDVSGVLAVANGGTGGTLYSPNAIMLGGSPLSSVGPLTNGQLLVGSTGSAPVAATLTAGAGISITPAAGAITIAETVDASTKVSKAGDTMSGALSLPSDGLVVGGNQLVASGGNVGIGTTSPASLLSAGATSQFQVDTNGDLIKVKNIAYSWPASQAAGAGYVLSNNGSGTLSWSAASAGGITGIATGTGLSGGPITTSGTLSLANTTVAAGSYTRANIIVDAQGRLTTATSGAAATLSSSDVTGILTVANGGTGGSSYNTGAVILGGTTFSSVNAGSSFQVFRMASGGSAPSYGAIDLSQSNAVTGLLNISNGGTGASSATQNYVFAAPSASTGAPSFRALVAGDIPWASPGTIGSSTPSTGAFTTLTASAITAGSYMTAAAGSVSIPSFTFTGSTSTGLYAPATNTLGITINGAEMVRINSAGNVGIGTTNPQGLLDVNQKLTVLGGGNVGIGSTMPSAKLQVSGTVASTMISSSSLTVDFSQGNFVTDSVAAGTLVLNNMIDGTTYTLILTNATGGNYTLSGSSVSSWRCSPACSSDQVSVTAGNHTMISITKAGTTAYVFWNSGL